MFDVTGYDPANDQTTPQQRRQINNICQLLTRVDRTLAGSSDVRVSDMSRRSPKEGTKDGTVAFTSQTWGGPTEIQINFAHESFDHVSGDASLAHVLGLNYHELGHTLFTPARQGNTAMNDISAIIRSEPLGPFAWNALEDGRIERMVAGEYGATRAYLLHTCLTMFKTLADKPEHLWVIVAPRVGLLPQSVVDGARKAVADMPKKDRKLTDADLDELVTIAGDFAKLAMPQDQKTGVPLIKRYIKIIEKLRDPSQDQNGDGGTKQLVVILSDASSHDQTPAGGASNNPGAGKQKQAMGKAAKQDEQQSGDGGGSGQKGDKAQNGAQGSGKGEGKGKGGKDKNDGQGGAQGGSGEGENEPTEKGVSEGSGTAKTGSAKDLSGIILQAIDENLTSDAVQQELAEHSRSLRQGKSFVSHLSPTKPTQIEPVDTQMKLAAKKAGAEFSRLAGTLDPGWDKRVSSGRLNVQRFMRENELDTAFDLWHEDKSDAAEVEAVLYIDMSSSMASGEDYLRACQGAWVLRESLAQIGGKVTVYGFNDGPMLFTRREDAHPRSHYPVWRPSGGTSVSEALMDSAPLFQRSKAKSKLAVVLTDGGFGDRQDAMQQATEDLKFGGAYLVKFQIGGNGWGGYGNYAEFFHKSIDVNTPAEVVPAVRQIVKQLIRRAAG